MKQTEKDGGDKIQQNIKYIFQVNKTAQKPTQDFLEKLILKNIQIHHHVHQKARRHINRLTTKNID